MPVFRLSNNLKYYTWGSPEFIPRLLGRIPDKSKPVAEMWMGAHPVTSSRIWIEDNQVSLRDYIRQYPSQTLGRAARHTGGGLPFLMKVLAAAQPLSIQAHPGLGDAKNGFERENALNIPLDSPLRNYKDANHKPEMICALTPFRALCGFRLYAEVIRNFRNHGLAPFFSGLSPLEADPSPHNFKSFIREVLGLSGSDKQAVLSRLVEALQSGPVFDDDIRQACLYLREFHPADTGLLAPLYLNVFDLEPGEALFLDAGVMHSYLEGAGLEIMATSDNVLRGGLTSKHIDLDELLNILDFSPFKGGILRPAAEDRSLSVYHTRAGEFVLKRLDLEKGYPYPLATDGLPLILFSENGHLTMNWNGQAKTLPRGGSAFITADTGTVLLEGDCRVWLASVPNPQN